MDRTEARPVLEELRAAMIGRDAKAAVSAVARLHPHAVAQALPRLSDEELARLLRLLGDERVAELVAQMAPDTAAQLLLRLSRPQAADVLEEMEPDDATDVLEELEPAEAESLLVEMEPAEVEDIRALLAYPPDTAGGRMTPEFVAVSPDLTVDEALAALRRLAAEAEIIYYVYVVDAEDRLLGVVSLRDLVLARPGTPVTRTMVSEVVKVAVDADQEEAARLLNEHGLLAIPVVDQDNRLLGIITADDVADVLEAEVTEDIARIGGAEPLEEPYLQAGVVEIVRKRVGWLLLLFVAEAYTGTVIRYFEGDLAQVVALAIFIPLLIGTGGNVGSQTVTTIVRAMAIGEVTFQDLLKVLGKEVAVGILLGGAMALAAFVGARALGVTADIGLVVAVAASLIVIWAAMIAAILPLTLRRLGVDPAVVSAPLITTLVDGTGLLMYFTIARLLLGL